MRGCTPRDFAGAARLPIFVKRVTPEIQDQIKAGPPVKFYAHSCYHFRSNRFKEGGIDGQHVMTERGMPVPFGLRTKVCATWPTILASYFLRVAGPAIGIGVLSTSLTFPASALGEKGFCRN